VTAELRRAGCVAAEREAAELLAAAGADTARLAKLVERRSTGEPLAWLTGSVRFCGETVRVAPGVYVPRPQSEPLARAAVARLPEGGVAVDLCTGSGAIAVVLARRRPKARVVATEIDSRAAACARENGIEVFEGDMAAGLPAALDGRVDVVTAVVPYVPSDELRLLARDVVAFEPRRALDGGADGTALLARAAVAAARLLRPGGSLLLELGGDQAGLLGSLLAERGYRETELLTDEEGDPRALVCRYAGLRSTSRGNG
jgi:release factor glutamine methyltransferase